MRLWSIHPKYLDAQGLVALWREGLLAQKVLAGKTKGYKFHPQLTRFKEMKTPSVWIAAYLHYVEKEAQARNYRFNRSKIAKPLPRKIQKIDVTLGQIKYESKHLVDKLKRRSPQVLSQWDRKSELLPHPLFQIVPGKVQAWEKRLEAVKKR